MRTHLLLFGLLCLGLRSQATPTDEEKNTDNKRWKNGFIVNLQGDTIRGKVKITDFLDVYYDYQRKLEFKDHSGITEYTPTELNSFSYYADRDSMVTLQSVSSPEGDGHVFLKLYFTGVCKVYGFMITDLKPGNQSTSQKGDGLIHSSLFPSEKKYIQIGGSQFFPLKRFGFKRDMREVFAACPHILSRIETKEYTYDNWQTLIRDYNCGCK